MARQATRLWAQCPPPGALISLAGAVGAAAAVTPDLSADSCGRSFEALCDPPYRPTGGNAARNLFALLKPQRYQSPPAWRWSNPSIASQDPIDAALVPPLKRSRDVRHTLTALPALPQLSLLFRREPCPCMPLHSHTSSSAKIRRCCVDSLNSPHKADIQRWVPFVRFRGKSGHPQWRNALRLLRLTRGASRSSRRLDAERLGNGGDLGALAFDRGGELLCSAARWRLRSRVELVVDGLVVGHRDYVGADALTQFRRQRLASEQADIAVHVQLGETGFDAGRNVGQARCPLAPHLRQNRDPAGLALRAQDGV